MLRSFATGILQARSAFTLLRAHPNQVHSLALKSGSSAAGYTAGVHASGQQLSDRWEVPAGSDLRISTRSPAAVRVVFGEPDAVSVQVDWKAPAGSLPRFALHKATATCIEVSEAVVESDIPATIHAQIPARFCSLELATAGGDVRLEGLQEARLAIRSNGGSVDVGKVRATQATISTGTPGASTPGGSLVGNLTAASANIWTNGGGIHLSKLLGKQLSVSAARESVADQPEVQDPGAEVRIDAAYAEHLFVDSGGLKLAVGELNCRPGSAMLHSGGGGLEVSGLDGSALLQSGGGPVQVRLHKNALSVHANSEGADITCFIPPDLTGHLSLLGRRLFLPPDVQASEGLQGRRLWNVAQLQGSQQGTDRITGQQPMELSNSSEEAQIAGITLDAGLWGCITVQQQSWLAAIAVKQGIKE
ncbi:hypothetical protein WJX74_005578 [Apatococcus lobatus]|uniref:Adhesin domain-containing protein n=1 Tax=Apatococcus lobatus TaxID=904363 RepID=A0AAW1RWM3_9CHLO